MAGGVVLGGGGLLGGCLRTCVCVNEAVPIKTPNLSLRGHTIAVFLERKHVLVFLQGSKP